MAKTWFFLAFVLIVLFGLIARSVPARGEKVPPMVEKHIFSPETVKKVPVEGKKSPAVKQIERKIAFTGVIISPQGRRAMIREKIRRKGKGRSELYKEGDEIASMTVKKIGSNYIILAGEGKDMKLNLYQGEKKRPAPPALPKVVQTPATTAGGQSGSSSAVAGKTPTKKKGATESTPKPRKPLLRSDAKTPNPPSLKRAAPKPSNPFLKALKEATRKRRESGGVTTPRSGNAFLEAIKRAKEK